MLLPEAYQPQTKLGLISSIAWFASDAGQTTLVVYPGIAALLIPTTISFLRKRKSQGAL